MRSRLPATLVVGCLAVAFLVAPPPASAQDAMILGQVTDAQNGQPLDGAQVFVVGTARGALADREGNYRLRVGPGTHTVRARLIGYETDERVVTIEAQQQINVDFELRLGGYVTEELVVTGSRTQRSAMETPVPVDVISEAEIRASPHTELNQIIRDIIPSFNAAHQTISDGTDHVNPASLRGLGPDQVLVLVNGKRRHHSALTHVNGTFGRGTVGVDLNAIPTSAVQRIEVLRDGAASQYGSDAIAGVVNIVLREQTDALIANVTGGATGEGDGDQVKADANFGFDVGEHGGFINVSGDYLDRSHTNRSDTFTGSVFDADRAVDDSTIAARGLTRDDFSMRTGQGDAIVGSAFWNASFPVSDGGAEIYSFGGLTHRKGEATGFYRRPIQEERVVFELYPNGFLPQIHTEIGDQALTGGVRGKKGPWDFDLGVTHGRNTFQFNIENTNNASMGATSPTSFDAGRLGYEETVGSFDAVRLIDTDGAVKSLSLVGGAEFRVERYMIGAGQFESYSLGNGGDVPGVDFDTTSTGAPKAAGSQVFPGFQPTNEVDRYRNNIGAYLGLETQFSDEFLLDLGGRFENYNDFGDAFIGKAAARFVVVEELALRAAVSNGFRAPSLNQIWFNNVSTQFVDDGMGNIVPEQVLTGNNQDPVTRAFGVPDLKEEKSINVSGGFTWRPLRELSVTADGYYIDIKDRIVLSSRFTDADSIVAEILAPFSALGVTQAQFFLNAVDTETKGVEIVANWSSNWRGGTLSAYASAAFTETKVKSINVPQGVADRFAGGDLAAVEETIFNREERNRLETALPRQNAVLGARFHRNRYGVGLRGNYFGEVLYRPTSPANDEDFGAKFTVDADVGWEFLPGVELVVGANNVFNTFPDKHTKDANYADGNFPYSRRVTQFGTNGGFYYGKLQLTLGS